MRLAASLSIPLPAQVVVAIRGNLFLLHNQGVGGVRSGRGGRDGLEIRFQKVSGSGQVVLVNLAALCAEAEAVVLNLEEGMVLVFLAKLLSRMRIEVLTPE